MFLHVCTCVSEGKEKAIIFHQKNAKQNKFDTVHAFYLSLKNILNLVSKSSKSTGNTNDYTKGQHDAAEFLRDFSYPPKVCFSKIDAGASKAE